MRGGTRKGGGLVLALLLSGCTGPNPAFRARESEPDGAPDRGAQPTGRSLDAGDPSADGDPPADTSVAPTPGDGAGELAPPDAAAVPPDLGVAPVCPGTAPAGWACIPAGTFTMGSSAAEIGRDGDETAHAVTISRPFWMKVTEVTQGEWRARMGVNPAFDSGCGDDCPVERVSWFEAIAFANALSIAEQRPPCFERPTGGVYDRATAAGFETPAWPTGLFCRGYRLATEAEWEYAARAGRTTAFHGGPITRNTDCSTLEPPLAEAGWYCANSANGIKPVGRKTANAWGLRDMHGNVWEWLWDLGTPMTDYAPGPITDPVGAGSGLYRRTRGGAYHNEPGRCRAANRDAMPPDSLEADLGFRLARTAF